MIYVQACADGEIRVSTVEARTGMPRAEVRKSIDRLVALRLLRGEDSEGPFAVVPPASARTLLIAPALRELRQREAQVNALSATFETLMRVYEAADKERLQGVGRPFEEIKHPSDVRDVIAALAAECTTEVLTSHPGGARPPEVLRESLARTQQLLARGVTMRTLYQHSARYDAATAAHVEHLAEAGAQVRTLAEGFAQVIIFDRREALMPLREHPRGAMLVRALNFVDFAVDAYDRSWSAASTFPVRPSRRLIAEASEDVKARIIRLLADGEEDRKIAARLGMSLRSCQRHISEIMKRLGARNRLHAGYLIHKHGLLESGPSEDSRTRADA
ncbi:LuxR C-terminal-related transcriptional regulator [Streptomyces sp. NPDC054871]